MTENSESTSILVRGTRKAPPEYLNLNTNLNTSKLISCKIVNVAEWKLEVVQHAYHSCEIRQQASLDTIFSSITPLLAVVINDLFRACSSVALLLHENSPNLWPFEKK